MKLKIRDVEYPMHTHVTADILYLMELKLQSREFTDDGCGLGMNALQKLADQAGAAAREGVEDMDLYVLWMGALVFLTRRMAEEAVTFKDAMRVPLAEIQPVKEDGDETPDGEGEADPTTPGPDTPETPADAPSHAAVG